MSPDTDAAAPPAQPEDRLAEAERALAQLRKQQEVLATGMSHDLRAPLRAITGYARLLHEHHAQDLGAEGRDYLERLRDAAARMDGLIGRLLQLSHAARAAVGTDAVDLSMLAEWSLAELQDTIPGLQIESSVQPGLLAMGDERQLKQVFDQLLHNACRFRGGDRPVSIDVSGEVSAGRTLVRVADRGIGFDMRYAGRIFEPFQRLHPAEKGSAHGLGLAIAHVIVERHSGRLWVESEPGRGSVFHIELPAAPAHGGDG